MSPDSLKAELVHRSRALGFARVGVAAAEALEPEGARLQAWLAAGHHASMDYMPRTAAVRRDPRHPGMLPTAQRVVVLAAPYACGRPVPPAGLGRIARYARGRDYHNVLYRRLRKLARWLRLQGHLSRAAVDSMPVFERAWAERAGLGFVGKNCCLIVPGIGSHLFLAALVTEAALPVDAPMSPRCGQCRRCLDACPTTAFVAPHSLDARRCISYLTIEHDGPIDAALQPQMGDWLFGCDVCQDVCPYNHGRGWEASILPDFAPGAAIEELDAPRLLTLSEPELQHALVGSALKRAGHARLQRNAAIVLGNRGTRRHLPLLAAHAARSASCTSRAAARWAMAAIESRHISNAGC
ncbi:MAG: tRNA epoxyqueuosine(34) reductase QueG [Polyangiales bacterium]